ncbi:unnamed protein product, partial [Bubo scandiacus]
PGRGGSLRGCSGPSRSGFGTRSLAAWPGQEMRPRQISTHSLQTESDHNKPGVQPGLGILGWVQGVVGVPSPGVLGSPRGTYESRPREMPRAPQEDAQLLSLGVFGWVYSLGRLMPPPRTYLRPPRGCSGPSQRRFLSRRGKRKSRRRPSLSGACARRNPFL